MTPADRPGSKDEIGPRRPRWPEPRSQMPLAIALDSKGPSGMRVPRVLASGRGAVAEQILEIAFARGIPVREDPDLAQMLAAIEVNAEIPIDAIAAVAEILSYIYRANERAGDLRGTDVDTFGPDAAAGRTENARTEDDRAEDRWPDDSRKDGDQ